MADISKRIERAEKYVQRGRLDDALEEYLYAYREDPTNDSLVEIIAELYLKQGQPQRALECFGYLFDKRAENKDGPGAVLIFRKMSRLGLQDAARMVQCAHFLEKTKPTESRDLYRQSAELFLQGGDKAKSLEALRGLAGLDAANPDAHLRVGELAETLGERELAGQSFTKAGELMRSSPNASRPDTLAALERAYGLLPGDLRVAELFSSSLLDAGQAARAVEVLKPLVSQPGPERNRLLAQAYIETGEFEPAEDLLWRQSSFPEAQELLWKMIRKLLDAGSFQPALSALRRMQQTMFAARKEEEFARTCEEFYEKYRALDLLDFLAIVYGDMHKPSKVSDALGRLYDAHLAAGNIPAAASALGRHVDNDNSDPRHKERLERLKEGLDPREYRSLSARVLGTSPGDEGGEGEQPAGSLDEMMLQAEMLMQFGSREAAVEYLKGVARQFPGEDAKSERLRSLYTDAGLPVSASAAAAAAPAVIPTGSGGMVMPECVAELARVPEITRNIHRQGTVKAILSAAVNEMGKAWQASRCLVGLCAPGKGPTAAMEYCAPGIKSSDAPSIVRLITATVQLGVDGDPLAFVDAPQDPALADLAPVVRTLGIQSLLIVPLMDGEQAVGVMLLQQCDRRRNWHPNEIYIGKTIVDQMVIAMSNVKMRSMMKAVSDERSGLLSRSAYIDCLLGEAARAQKHSRPLAVALLRLGSGQALDREFGDQARLKYMQDAGQALLGQLRDSDIGVRYDPQTLALVLPDTPAAHLSSVVARVRTALSNVQIASQPGLPITAAMGEAVLGGGIDAVDSVTELVNRLEQGIEAAVKEHASAKLLQAVR